MREGRDGRQRQRQPTTKVARQSRRNSQTPSTASTAPSISRPSSLRSFPHRIDEIEGLGDLMSGRSASSFASARHGHRRPRSRRPLAAHDPRSRPPACRSSKAAERRSPTVSVTDLIQADAAPSDEAISMLPSSSAVAHRGRLRTDCSMPPISDLPPDASCWMRNWREISAAVAFRANSGPGRFDAHLARHAANARDRPRHRARRAVPW